MNAQRASAVIIVAGLAALVVWWRWPAAPAPKRISLVHVQPPHAPEDPDNPPVVPPQPAPVEPPPAPVAAMEAPPLTPPSAFDPQAELYTAVPDFLRLAQSGDFATLVLTYAPPTPGMSEEDRVQDAQMFQAKMQTPEAQQELQKMIADLQFIQNSPPVISENGNRATYTLPAGSGEQDVVFVKGNGRWYRE